MVASHFSKVKAGVRFPLPPPKASVVDWHNDTLPLCKREFNSPHSLLWPISTMDVCLSSKEECKGSSPLWVTNALLVQEIEWFFPKEQVIGAIPIQGTYGIIAQWQSN